MHEPYESFIMKRFTVIAQREIPKRKIQREPQEMPFALGGIADLLDEENCRNSNLKNSNLCPTWIQ